MSPSNNERKQQSDDSLMAPIPRKKRSSHPAPAASSALSLTHQETDSSVSYPTIPRKASALAKRAPSVLNERSTFSKRTETRPPAKYSEFVPSTGGREPVGGNFPSFNSLLRVVSESPLVLKIKIALDSFEKQRSSQRQPKRARPDYQEMELIDSDDFLTDDDAPPKKKGRLVPYSAFAVSKSSKTDRHSDVGTLMDSAQENSVGPAADTGDALVSADGMAPPEGMLSTLWYSREDFDQIFVLEKILAYKTRPVVKLVSSTTSATSTTDTDATPKQPEPYVLDQATALHLQQTLLQNEVLWADVLCRMEVSRVVPHQCPAILVAATVRENHLAKREGRKPDFYLSAENQQEEDVLLVKWRGRSHMHCSWERSSDIQRLDTSNNSTARNKIRRYYQIQETAFGPDWKKVIKSQEAEEGVTRENTDGEEYFPIQYLELERILACDETEMNLDVLAKQRGRNMRFDQAALQRRDVAREGSPVHECAALHPHTEKIEDSFSTAHYEPLRKLFEDHTPVLNALLRNFEEVPWDPEDNVRYVVKWKGLPYSEVTWEYWRNIKADAVDLVEDYWHRQRPPQDPFSNKPHPNIRDFKKLQESPSFGVSSRERPVIGFEPEKDEDAFGGFKLRSYQMEGVNWLLFNWWNKRSCILADEMGLGKTIQSTAFLRELQTNPHTQIRGPFLIVAPLSLAGQWQSELASWAPDMNVVLYHGSADARDFLVREEFYFIEPFVNKGTAAKLRKQNVTKFHVLITTYEVVLKDTGVLSKIRWKVLIVDEAHRLKNHRARLFDELAAVPRDHCVLLTGTPIANATEELWALLHFANPTAFTDREEFLSKFGEMTDVHQVNELHSLLRPYLLRRVKEDVEKSLPPKEETILEVSLTPIQKTFYKAIYERNTSFLFKGAKASNAPSLMNVMMELRKCCNHPFLVKGAEERILADAAAKLQEKTGESIPVDHVAVFAEQLVKSSGKMVLIEKLLQKLFVGGHKVLIFSQMVRVLDLLEELLKLKHYRYERLDGSTSSSARSASVDRFIRKSFQRFVMLLSTRAGGLGLNLTAADVVIIFDSDWNPQNDLQAMARAHRIGQEKRVMIYRLLTAKTYEMHMFHSASLKLGLERAVLSQNREQGDESDDKSKKKPDRDAQAREIDELLKKGAYDVFRDEDDTEAEKFMETDIDQLLAHSSKKVTYGASATSSLGSGLGSFSKASFVTETDDGAKDVDLDDPDFWSKAVGLDAPVEISEEVAAMLDDGVKRNRKQVQVYDPYAETAEAEQRKKEKLALEKLLEKEEKERQRLEKKEKKEAAKNKKKKEREEQLKSKEQAAKQAASKTTKEEQPKKVLVESKLPKKSKKNERQRALRRSENENPVLEQLKQAWEVPQRNRATAAVMRFGFGRFCKIRHESNLTSLPLQDLEIFTRAYFYQIGLQVGTVLLAFIRNGGMEEELSSLVQDWLGATYSTVELEFIFDSVAEVLQCHQEVEKYRRLVRMPVILAEPSYVVDLRKGAAFRGLRRVGVLNRLNFFIEQLLDEILLNLGHEELGKRGCAYGDLSCLDVDLKARFVTTEELTLAIGANFRGLLGRQANPTVWWDRECDVGLILGTFIHGLGNYKSIGSDSDLCFSRKMKTSFDSYGAYRSGVENFNLACKAARKVFDDALEAGRIKAEHEVQAAVAAAAKAAKEREEDAAVLREGREGVEAAIKNMPETQVDDAFKFDGTDSHFVTLPRMQDFVRGAFTRSGSSADYLFHDDTTDVPDEPSGRSRNREYVLMPDARVLDHRLLLLLREIEQTPTASAVCGPSEFVYGGESDDILANIKARSEVFETVIGESIVRWTHEFSGVGLGSYQCGTAHRSLDDGTDYGHGSATSQLAQVAYGTDAPRYLRQLGVPMNLTRYAVCALLHVDSDCVEQLLIGESLKYYGSETGKRRRNEGAKCKGSGPENSNDVKEGSSDRDDPSSPASVAHSASTAQATYSGQTFENERLARIPEEFRNNSRLRALTCLTVLLYGYPTKISGPVDSGIMSLLNDEVSDQFFDLSSFRSVVANFGADLKVPSESALSDYIEKFLIPHCLQLCLYGNGPSTRDARGSQGEYETALGVNLHPEASRPHQSPIPDPCLSVHEHSMEAVCHASAILRRVQLLRASQFICSCQELSADLVDGIARSRKMGDLRELPFWWCPWTHDIALLVQAATKGLFSIIKTKNDHPVFSQRCVEDFLRSALSSSGIELPGSDNYEKTNDWIRQECEQFPTMNQIERRLSFFCDLITSNATNGADRYCHLPMFDHGGCPRS